MQRIVGGESLSDVARDMSSCPSKEKGGDLGWFRRGQMVPEFETACFEHEAGAMMKVCCLQMYMMLNDERDKSFTSAVLPTGLLTLIAAWFVHVNAQHGLRGLTHPCFPVCLAAWCAGQDGVWLARDRRVRQCCRPFAYVCAGPG